MDFYPHLQALILGLVEGLTEFLPISSTGHLILAGSLLDFNDERGKLFEIVIQSGAILAVCWEYRQRLAQIGRGVWQGNDPASRRFVLNIAIAFLPLAVLGLAFGKVIKAHLFTAPVVASLLIGGGLVILWAERRTHTVRIETIEALTPRDALVMGLFQALALFPGTSRSGATIIGGLLYGLSRRAATEFSFFLAMPTLILASMYELYRDRALLRWQDLDLWIIGFVTAAVSAFVCVRWLLRFIAHHDFTPFAWYRIGFGLLILASWHWGWVTWAA
ncbi:UDP pyrophosphate phosphatase [Rugosibacter aromaticivorans]|uniref:Undecaprenyl-diphosphatase n=1 Tax=Rugosibacter aromaticivorans TaxID=1565605 RepID=A0A0C5J248_9PROT|nr:undecaprenyl-diphosphate phosphatase [Rugosibacter aromaticivorans]AJP49112.1 UDP pyrophosphate phosphatase [Rugosibacter aromaticivorans]